MNTDITNQMEALAEFGIDVNMFYSVNFFSKDKIQLQGRLSSDTRKNCESYGFSFQLEKKNDWLTASKIITNGINVQIALTF